MLLLFFLGLEFSLDRLTAARRIVVMGGLVNLVVNAGLGLLVGIALVGPGPEAVLLAGLIYISSSGIVTRALYDLRRLGDDETDLVLGVLVFEDLAIAVFLGVAAALASGESVGGAEIVATAGIALAFVVAFLLVGRWAHHAIDRIGPRLDREQLLLGALAIALGGAALADAAGLSEAVGALLAGILLLGSEVRTQIEQQLLGLRRTSRRRSSSSRSVSRSTWARRPTPPNGCSWRCRSRWRGSSSGATLGRSTGFTSRESVNVGAALVARGEFTIILAQLAAGGVALDAAFRELVSPFAGLFVLATAVAGVVYDERVAAHREARVPEPLAEPTMRR